MGHGHFWRHFVGSHFFVWSLGQAQSIFIMPDLYDAAEAGDLERVQVLVEQGADKDEVNEDGQTPLYIAACIGHLAVVRYLVEQGADMEKVYFEWTPLIIASIHGKLEVVRYLLDQGANRDKADDSRRTPLHHAARNGHLETAKLLMLYGADLNTRDSFGLLPIDMDRLNNEEIKQAIRDEPRRRLDHGHKRATEQDRHPNAAASASAQQEENEADEAQSTKQPEEGEAEEGKADEDQDSEPSCDEDGN